MINFSLTLLATCLLITIILLLTYPREYLGDGRNGQVPQLSILHTSTWHPKLGQSWGHMHDITNVTLYPMHTLDQLNSYSSGCTLTTTIANTPKHQPVNGGYRVGILGEALLNWTIIIVFPPRYVVVDIANRFQQYVRLWSCPHEQGISP